MKTLKNIKKIAEELNKNPDRIPQEENLARVGNSFIDLYCADCKKKVEKILTTKGKLIGMVYLAANAHNIVCIKCQRKLRKRTKK